MFKGRLVWRGIGVDSLVVRGGSLEYWELIFYQWGGGRERVPLAVLVGAVLHFCTLLGVQGMVQSRFGGGEGTMYPEGLFWVWVTPCEGGNQFDQYGIFLDAVVGCDQFVSAG